MKPRGLLMIEHRLIEKMLAFARSEADRIEQTGSADASVIDRKERVLFRSKVAAGCRRAVRFSLSASCQTTVMMTGLPFPGGEIWDEELRPGRHRAEVSQLGAGLRMADANLSARQ